MKLQQCLVNKQTIAASAIIVIGALWALCSQPSRDWLNGSWVVVNGLCSGQTADIHGLDITESEYVLNAAHYELAGIDQTTITPIQVSCERIGSGTLDKAITLESRSGENQSFKAGTIGGIDVLVKGDLADQSYWFKVSDAFIAKYRTIATHPLLQAE